MSGHRRDYATTTLLLLLLCLFLPLLKHLFHFLYVFRHCCRFFIGSKTLKDAQGLSGQAESFL